MNKEEQKRHIIDLMNMGDYKTNTMKTAIEIFRQEIQSILPSGDIGLRFKINEAAKRAEEVHRQQIGEAWADGATLPSYCQSGEMYYQSKYSETFKPE